MVRVDLQSLVKQELERRNKESGRGVSLTRSETLPEDAIEILRRGTESQPVLDHAAYRVGSENVEGLTYIPNFLSREESSAAVQAIEASPSSRWVSAGERRMQNWGGRPGACRLSEPLPPFLTTLVHRLVTAGIYSKQEAPNHVLINEYSEGAGISPHQDGPLYLDRVATITLSGAALLYLHEASPEGEVGSLVTSVLLKPGCLFVTSAEAYSRCLHSIASRKLDVISEHCCNARLAGVTIGEAVPRAPKRYSLVFVHKKQSY